MWNLKRSSSERRINIDLALLDKESLDQFLDELSAEVGDCQSTESASELFSRYMYDKCVHNGERNLVLSRVFQSFSFSDFPDEISKIVTGSSQSMPDPTSKFLVLLGTNGDEKEWCDRRFSQGHKAIPLDPNIVKKIPMLSRALNQIGLRACSTEEIEEIHETNDASFKGLTGSFGVFHVENANGSQYIPAQDEFVIPHNVSSVLGAGAKLPNGEISLFIGFSRHRIPEDSAMYFSSALVKFWRSAYGNIDQVFDS